MSWASVASEPARPKAAETSIQPMRELTASSAIAHITAAASPIAICEPMMERRSPPGGSTRTNASEPSRLASTAAPVTSPQSAVENSRWSSSHTVKNGYRTPQVL